MPRRLLSLPMLANYANVFALLSADIEKMHLQLLMDAELDPEIKTFDPASPRMARFREHISTLLATCGQVPQLSRMEPPLGRLLARIDDGIGASELHHNIDHMQHQLFDELNQIQLYHVPSHLVGLYNDPMAFGQEVFDRFPAANEDIARACQCLALGQPTAAVFHLMRVSEAALKAISKDADIPYQPNWDAYIRKLTAKFGEDYKKKTPAWRKKEPFYEGVLGDLAAIKIAWRNPTMHIVSSFDGEQAQNIFMTTRALMMRVASKLKQPRGLSLSPVGVEVQP